MHLRLLPLGLGIAVLLLGACSRKTDPAVPAAKTAPETPQPAAVALVKASERSRSFEAVNRQLELGGTLYGYVDIEGDLLGLTGHLQAWLKEVARTQPAAQAVAQQDLGAIMTTLGLTDIKALGVSSVPDGNGYFRNRLFVCTPGERRGLLAAFGGKPGPFKHVGLAPADAAFYAESEMDLAIVYRTLKDVVNRVAGEPAGNQLEGALKKAGDAAAISILDLIYGFKGHSAVVLRLDPEKTMRLPGAQPLDVPAFSLVVCVEGIGQVIESTLAKSRELRRSDSGTQHVYSLTRPLPIEGLEPAFVVDGTTLFFTTSVAFLHECRTQATNLGQTPEYKAALAQLGSEGNGISWVSPRLFEQLRRIETLNPNLAPEQKTMLKFMLAQMPPADRPLAGIRTNLPDGILVRSYLNRSLKQDLAMASLYNPVSVGLVAAMAIPAFQKTRAASQEKAIVNNLRQLSAAADQYYLENGKTSASYNDLVGPDRYVKRLQPVAGENYRSLIFKQGQPLRVRLPDGRTIQYPMR